VTWPLAAAGAPALAALASAGQGREFSTDHVLRARAPTSAAVVPAVDVGALAAGAALDFGVLAAAAYGRRAFHTGARPSPRSRAILGRTGRVPCFPAAGARGIRTLCTATGGGGGSEPAATAVRCCLHWQQKKSSMNCGLKC
jgi:hypothetical protein